MQNVSHLNNAVLRKFLTNKFFIRATVLEISKKSLNVNTSKEIVFPKSYAPFIRPRNLVSQSILGHAGLRIRQSRKSSEKNDDNSYFSHFTIAGMLSYLGLSKEKTDEEEDELVIIIKRSVLLIQAGELKKAEQLLHVALRLAQQKQSAEGITYVYDLMANVAMEAGEFTKAEKLFVSVMQRLLGSGVSQDDNKVTHISLKLAEIYFLQSDKPGFEKKAEEGLRFVMDAQQKKMDAGEKDDDTMLLWSLAAEGQSKIMGQRGQLTEARSLLEKALDLSEKASDGEARRATLLSDLGAVCSMNGDHEAAYGYLLKAVEFGRAAKVEHLPAFLVNLGIISMYRGLKKEATESCREAWKLARSNKNIEAEKEAASCLDEIKKFKI